MPILYYTTFHVYSIHFDGAFYNYNTVASTSLEVIKDYINSQEKTI